MTTPPGDPHHRSSRTNQALVAGIAVVALAVAGMLGYVLTQHRGDGPTAASAPTVSAHASDQASQSEQAPRTVTAPASTVTRAPAEDTQAPAQDSGQDSAADSGVGDIPNLVATSGDYAAGRDGSALTVYRTSGGSPEAVGHLTLNGSGSDVSMVNLPGCTAPIVVWDTSTGRGSAAFGMDDSGTYQMFVARSGQYNLYPEGGDGSRASTYGVYDRGTSIAYNDDGSTPYNQFDGCESDGTTLHWFTKGD